MRALLDRLPDDCTLDDVRYHLCVAQSVARGVADERESLTIAQAQVEAEMRREWLTGSGR